MKISSKSIKKKAEELGFQKVGIARAEKTPKEKLDLDSWLMQGNHATMDWITKRKDERGNCLLYTSPSPRDATLSRMPSSA